VNTSSPKIASRLVRTRLKAMVQQSVAKPVAAQDGVMHVFPGQGGVITGINLGSPAADWLGDHVEPGISLGHADPAANEAIRMFCCVGNAVTMVDGPAAGAAGIVSGKHGSVLAMFAQHDLKKIAPGEWAVIEAQGLGLHCPTFPELTVHSCSPDLFEQLVTRTVDNRLRVGIAAVLPSIAAAAGIGMQAAMFNMDINSSVPPVAELVADLRYGDIVAVLDQDHQHVRRHRPGWSMIGVISHGTAVRGGHGFGLMTLLTAPTQNFVFDGSEHTNIAGLLRLPWQPQNEETHETGR
jgi:hypothetical protein